MTVCNRDVIFYQNVLGVFFKSITSPYGDNTVHCEWRVTYGYVIIQLIIFILYHMNVRKCYMLPHNNSTHINMHFNVIISPTMCLCNTTFKLFA